MTVLLDRTARQLLDAFAAPAPTPGGGSAAAFAGALGASLLMMVASLPKTRHGTPEDSAALQAASDALTRLRDRLAALVDDDTAAYDAVVEAYRLPKGDDGRTRVRQDAIQRALRGATEVPLDVLRASEAAARQSIVVARHGNPSAASDTGVGLRLLRAAFAGAALNVHANLGQVRDADYVSEVSESVRRLEEGLGAAEAAVEDAFRRSA